MIWQIGLDTPLMDLRHFALDTELALPSWYSTTLLLVCAALLYLIARATRADGGRDWGRWMMLSVIFLLMSLDEAASFHEVLMRPMRSAFDATGIFYYTWVVPGAIGVLVLGLYFLPFVLRLPRSTAAWIVLAGMLYVGGALGLELFGGAFDEAWGTASLPYIFVSVLEESLEIAGLSVFVMALCTHIGTQWRALDVTVLAEAPWGARAGTGRTADAA
ncbi:hypothetical protein [Pelagibacterium xiamenense]|uniref:hypothetical protein n=1 Tax=Pelagibacterium xiamenense TaxID=2901140 RepID=UPI001E44DC0E|nr:hypothetical protein [Pelagibacterium xiamenense]MCD7060467.1 hypothetical protein [Pelagibacterium xiamenense]